MYKLFFISLLLFSYKTFATQNNWFGLIDFTMTSKKYENIADTSLYICSKGELLGKIQFVPKTYIFDYLIHQKTYYILYLESSFMKKHKDSTKNMKSITAFLKMNQFRNSKPLVGYISNQKMSCTSPKGYILKNLLRYRSIMISHEDDNIIESSI